MSLFPDRDPDGLIEKEFRRIADDCRPVDAGRRERFLATVAAHREGRYGASRRFARWRRRAILALSAAGVTLGFVAGAAGAGGVDDIAGRLRDAVAQAPFVGGDEHEPTAIPSPDAHPLQGGEAGERPASGIDTSNASETGREHANPNASDGAGNAEEKGDNRNTDRPDRDDQREGQGGRSDAARPGPPGRGPQGTPRAR